MSLDEPRWMDSAKAKQFVGIGAGTNCPKLGRAPWYASAWMPKLTIEWE